MSSPWFDASRLAARKPFEGRVLLSHDDDLERVELAARLTELGWSVCFVAGPEALVDAALRDAPTLVLVGLACGASAVVQLRARGYSGLIIGLSNAPWPAGEREGQDCGCNDVVEVAVPLLELKLRLRVWLEPRVIPPVTAALDGAAGGRWQRLWRRLRGAGAGGTGHRAA